jgi:hyperosmotically inducible protein
MKRFLHFALAGTFVLANGLALAQSMAPAPQVLDTQGFSGDEASHARMVRSVRHELLMIPQLSIFDDLSYQVDGSTVTLLGEVRNPVIKDEAQAVVKHIEGVETIKNRIEILPVSFNDDRIRRQVAQALFHDPRLSLYAIQPVPPIHIIVKNGHVDLQGVVRDQGDKNTAGIRANEVPGVFSVENDLRVEKS